MQRLEPQHWIMIVFFGAIWIWILWAEFEDGWGSNDGNSADCYADAGGYYCEDRDDEALDWGY